MEKRIIIVGDVHGCLEETKRLLDVLKYDTQVDRLIFLGDLVDRGPESAACIQYVRYLGAECVMGNHDQKLTRYHKHELKRLNDPKYRNPINYSKQQIEQYKLMSTEDMNWLKSIPNYILIEESNIVLMHAGVMGHHHPLQQPKDAYVYCRYVDKGTGRMVNLGRNHQRPDNSLFWTDLYEYPLDVVYGHQVVSLDKPRIVANDNDGTTYGIDTGACYGGRLTALVLETDGQKNIVQVESDYKFKDFELVDREL
jgi:bis(5'-nucleosyl)-tetraphosphatase (symmetrical)